MSMGFNLADLFKMLHDTYTANPVHAVEQRATMAHIFTTLGLGTTAMHDPHYAQSILASYTSRMSAFPAQFTEAQVTERVSWMAANPHATQDQIETYDADQHAALNAFTDQLTARYAEFYAAWQAAQTAPH
jgi:hypothetical protein